MIDQGLEVFIVKEEYIKPESKLEFIEKEDSYVEISDDEHFEIKDHLEQTVCIKCGDILVKLFEKEHVCENFE